MKILQKIGFLLIFVGFAIGVQAQSLPEYEQQIEQLFAAVENSTDGTANQRTNDSIRTLFQAALKCEGSFHYPFSRLNFVGHTLSDDGLLRIYTWNIPTDSGFIYNGFVQKLSGEYRILTQQNTPFATTETQTVSSEEWYGALYYRAIAYKYQKQKIYILLGWQGGKGHTQRKFIDVLWFDKAGQMRLGLPIFENDGYAFSRRVFEYDADVQMFLDYEPKRHRIVFDHLSPIKLFDDEVVTLGPDMSFDAYQRRAKVWKLQEDIKAKNK